MGLYLNDSPEGANIKDLINNSLGVKTSSYSEAVLVLTCLAGSISYEELFSIFSHLPQIFRAKVIPKLVKDELLKKQMFPRPDGASVSYFVCTKKGLDMVREICGLKQYVPPRVKGSVSPHSYAVGYNLYQLILHGHAFKWFKEAPYDNPGKESLRWMKGSELRSDCTALYDSGRVLRIEEDRGNENSYVLLDKISNYARYGCFDDLNDVLLFSIRQAGIGVPDRSAYDGMYIYSPARCKALIQCMEERGIDDAVLLLGHKEIFSAQEYLAGLYSRVSQTGLDGLPLFYLKELYKTLYNSICPMQQEDFNKAHMQAAGTILRYAVSGFGTEKNISDRVALALMEGRVVGFVPTSLVGSCLPYLMLSEHIYERTALMGFIGAYYGDVRFHGETAPALRVGEYGNALFMRNCFISENGGLNICVEYPSIDLGAWIRVRAFADNMGSIRRNDQIICVFNTEKDARDFFNYTDYDAGYLAVTHDRPAVYGIYAEDIYDGGSMFVASGEGGDKYFVPVMP